VLVNDLNAFSQSGFVIGPDIFNHQWVKDVNGIIEEPLLHAGVGPELTTLAGSMSELKSSLNNSMSGGPILEATGDLSGPNQKLVLQAMSHMCCVMHAEERSQSIGSLQVQLETLRSEATLLEQQIEQAQAELVSMQEQPGQAPDDDLNELMTSLHDDMEALGVAKKKLAETDAKITKVKTSIDNLKNQQAEYSSKITEHTESLQACCSGIDECLEQAGFSADGNTHRQAREILIDAHDQLEDPDNSQIRSMADIARVFLAVKRLANRGELHADSLETGVVAAESVSDEDVKDVVDDVKHTDHTAFSKTVELCVQSRQCHVAIQQLTAESTQCISQLEAMSSELSVYQGDLDSTQEEIKRLEVSIGETRARIRAHTADSKAGVAPLEGRSAEVQPLVADVRGATFTQVTAGPGLQTTPMPVAPQNHSAQVDTVVGNLNTQGAQLNAKVEALSDHRAGSDSGVSVSNEDAVSHGHTVSSVPNPSGPPTS